MLKGTLGHFTMPEIFRLVSSHRTGCLLVRKGDADGTLYFREGTVYFARSSLTSEPLGKRLVGSRDLTERQLEQALEVHNRTGSNLGEILVDLGFITLERLEGALRMQIEDAVVDLLGWEEGEFEWQPGVGVDVEFAVAARVEDLIIEASRRLDAPSVIDRKIPSIDLVPSMSPDPPADAEEINIAAEEWRALVLADGHRTIGEIAAAVGIDGFTARRTFYALEAAGLVEISSSRAQNSGRASAAPVAERPPEDAATTSSATFDAYSAWLPSTSQEEAEAEFRRAAGLDFDDDEGQAESPADGAPDAPAAPASGFLDDLFNEPLVLGSTSDEVAGVDPAFSELEAPLRDIAEALRSEEPGSTPPVADEPPTVEEKRRWLSSLQDATGAGGSSPDDEAAAEPQADDAERRAELRRAEREKADHDEQVRIEAAQAELARRELEARELEARELERAETERQAAARAAERAEAERAERERAETARREQERLEKERLEKERLEKERLEKERLEQAQLEQAQLEQERLQAEQRERERLEAERLEAERVEAERLERDRAERDRIDRALRAEERARLEAARVEAERLEAERLEAERLEAERLEAERLEAERLEAERREQERLAAAARELEKERQAAEADTTPTEPEVTRPPAAEPAAPPVGPPAGEPVSLDRKTTIREFAGLFGDDEDEPPPVRPKPPAPQPKSGSSGDQKEGSSGKGRFGRRR